MSRVAERECIDSRMDQWMSDNRKRTISLRVTLNRLLASLALQLASIIYAIIAFIVAQSYFDYILPLTLVICGSLSNALTSACTYFKTPYHQNRNWFLILFIVLFHKFFFNSFYLFIIDFFLIQHQLSLADK